MTISALYQLFLQHPSVQTDTRALKPGDIFFALKGPNFNANAFAAKALEMGAAYAVIDEADFHTSEKTILVDDVLTTLQQLAQHHRRKFMNRADGKKVPFIAITGSNGKTTTKELIHAVLSSHFITYTTRGNLNNHIGIPLTLLRVQQDAEMAVIEMGANHQKEIEGYCKYTLPTHGLITNCGKAHLEGFGGVEGVRKGKGELFDFLRANNGTAFAMWDYDYLREMSAGIPKVIRYGTEQAEVEGKLAASTPFLAVQLTNVPGLGTIQTQLVGDYNLPNVLAAVAVGIEFGVPMEKIAAAIEAYTPTNSRSQLVKKGSNTIILDAYNANPSSMKAAIANFAAQPGDHKILMLGAMMELGSDSKKEHEDLAAFIAAHPWEEVVLVGGDFAHVMHPFTYLPDAEAAGNWLQRKSPESAQLLIKGSRSMGMEKVLEKL